MSCQGIGPSAHGAPNDLTDGDKPHMTQDSFQTDLVVTRTEFDGCREVQLGVGHVCYFTTRAPGKDSANEDSLALVRVDSGRGVLAIADGFGGQPAGDQASELAVKTVASTVQRAALNGQDMRVTVMDSFELANEAVLALGVGAASTLAVVEIDGDVVRAYLIRISHRRMIDPQEGEPSKPDDLSIILFSRLRTFAGQPKDVRTLGPDRRAGLPS